MFPPKPTKPSKKNTGVYVESWVLERADEIARTEAVKSRNVLLGSFLTFAVELFPLLRPLRARVEAAQQKEGGTFVETIARLVERGLAATERGRK